MVLLVIYLFILAFFFGASVASFAGVAIERIPQRKTLWGRSYCACGRQLKATENIPVIGWLKTGGTATCCGSKIPAWYFVSEMLAGMMMAAIVAAIII